MDASISSLAMKFHQQVLAFPMYGLTMTSHILPFERSGNVAIATADATHSLDAAGQLTLFRSIPLRVTVLPTTDV
jgi:hypothetical protein